jgi:hypothetical protein
LLKIKNDRLTDEQVLFLSDIVCTGSLFFFSLIISTSIVNIVAWHANVLGGVGPGTTVAIW